MDKKKTILIGIFVCFFIGLFCFGVFMIDRALQKTKPEEELSERDKTLTNMGVPKEDYEKMTDEEKDALIEEEYYQRTASDYIYTKGNKEYEDTKNLRTSLISYLNSFNFSQVVSKMDPIVKKYNFTTDENRELAAIYTDAKMLTNIYTLTGTGYANVLQNATSNLIYTLIYLASPIQLVKESTLSDNARYPLYEGIVNIIDSKKITIDELKQSRWIQLFENYVHEGNEYYQVDISGKTITGTNKKVTCYSTRYSEGVRFNMLGCFIEDNSLLLVNELAE